MRMPADGVAAHEFRGAVHGAIEVALAFQFLAAAAGLFFIDHPGGEIGVDRHLLAGHGVEGEAGGDFGDAARTLRDDHEVHDDQDDKDHDPDDEVAAHHKVAERLDDVAGSFRPLVAVSEDEAGGRDVQRKPQQCRKQQHSGEGGEFKRLLDQ